MEAFLRPGQTIRLHFKEASVYLSPGPISISSTNLPKFVKKFDQIAHWDCRIVKYNNASETLHLEVLSYQKGSCEIPAEQVAAFGALRQIQALHFRSVNTEKLLTTARTKRAYQSKIDASIPHEESEVRERTISLSIPFSDCTIEFGGVYFQYQPKGYSNSVEVFVENINLRPEFDAVKSYFPKCLGKSFMDVELTLEFHDDYAEVVEATSVDLGKIDRDFIEQVRFEFVRETNTKKLLGEIDKSIFTMDEYFATTYDESYNANTFHGSAMDLLADLLQVSNSRHYQHLQYLASHHCSTIVRLRFVLDPMSFLFLLEGKKDYHLVWETLDTKEATYVWHVNKSKRELKSLLLRVEAVLGSIRAQGKTAYLSSRPDRFHRITHDYSNLVDGFVKWRTLLESTLT